MKTVKTRIEETVMVEPIEKEIIFDLASKAMYKNEKFNVDTRFCKIDDNHFQIYNDAVKSELGSNMVIEVKFSPATDEWGKDNFFMHLSYAELEVNVKTGAPIYDDWYAAFHSLIDRANIVSRIHPSTLIPSSTPRIAFEVLNRSYYVYNDMEDFKGPDGKMYRRPKEAVVKLSTGINIEDKVVDMIKPVPKATMYLVLGSSDNKDYKSEDSDRFMNFVDEKNLEAYLGVKPTDTVKMWDLIESRKITPIFNMGMNIDEALQNSIILIERVLAENKINPKFSKSNLII